MTAIPGMKPDRGPEHGADQPDRPAAYAAATRAPGARRGTDRRQRRQVGPRVRERQERRGQRAAEHQHRAERAEHQQHDHGLVVVLVAALDVQRGARRRGPASASSTSCSWLSVIVGAADEQRRRTTARQPEGRARPRRRARPAPGASGCVDVDEDRRHGRPGHAGGPRRPSTSATSVTSSARTPLVGEDDRAAAGRAPARPRRRSSSVRLARYAGDGPASLDREARRACRSSRTAPLGRRHPGVEPQV